MHCPGLKSKPYWVARCTIPYYAHLVGRHVYQQHKAGALQAVIGAGAAGLVAARELANEGHKVTVFEKGSCTGGVWVYTDKVESPDLLGKAAQSIGWPTAYGSQTLKHNGTAVSRM